MIEAYSCEVQNARKIFFRERERRALILITHHKKCAKCFQGKLLFPATHTLTQLIKFTNKRWSTKIVYLIQLMLLFPLVGLKPLSVYLFVLRPTLHWPSNVGRMGHIVVFTDHSPRSGGVMVKAFKGVANQGRGHHHGISVFRNLRWASGLVVWLTQIMDCPPYPL